MLNLTTEVPKALQELDASGYGDTLLDLAILYPSDASFSQVTPVFTTSAYIENPQRLHMRIPFERPHKSAAAAWQLVLKYDPDQGGVRELHRWVRQLTGSSTIQRRKKIEPQVGD